MRKYYKPVSGLVRLPAKDHELNKPCKVLLKIGTIVFLLPFSAWLYQFLVGFSFFEQVKIIEWIVVYSFRFGCA